MHAVFYQMHLEVELGINYVQIVESRIFEQVTVPVMHGVDEPDAVPGIHVSLLKKHYVAFANDVIV